MTSSGQSTQAEQFWAEALSGWAIPQHILDAAPENPWGFPVERFAGRADRAVHERSGPSYQNTAELIAEALPSKATVLDVGAGAGAASLPHAPECSSVTAVDNVPEMLEAFSLRAEALHVNHREVLGTWPACAGEIPAHDVVVTHHVVYNVADIGPFVEELTGHARRGVVVELPPEHPLSWMRPLWRQFHQLERPISPTIDDFLAILRRQGVRDLRVERWTRFDPVAADGSESQSAADRAALVTRRLCLPRERAPEVAAALRQMSEGNQREVVTVRWAGRSPTAQ